MWPRAAAGAGAPAAAAGLRADCCCRRPALRGGRAARGQRRSNYSLPMQSVPEPPNNPPSAVQRWQQGRERLVSEEYHYPDSKVERDPAFDRRLAVYQKLYESQEMDGRVRWCMQKEIDAAQREVGRMTIREAKPLVKEQRVTLEQRLEEARARIVRHYKGVDADLRSGEPGRMHRAEHQLKRVTVLLDDDRWDYAAAAHRRLGAELQGPPGEAERVEAQNEIDGSPDADPAVLAAFETGGFGEKEEFAMLRREVGEEAAEELHSKLQQNRDEIVRRRLKHTSDWIKLNQLEKKMVLDEYRTLFDGHHMMASRQDFARKHLADAKVNQAKYNEFEARHALDAEAGLNDAALRRLAALRARRASVLRERQAAAEGGAESGEAPSAPRRPRVHWESTTGLVHNPRQFVDADWWELAGEDPAARHAYAQRLREDVRSLRGPPDPVSARAAEAAVTARDAQAFADFRRSKFDRGYSSSQVLHYEGDTGEPANRHFMDRLNRPVHSNPLGGTPWWRKREEKEFTSGGMEVAGPLTWQRWEREKEAREREPPGIGRPGVALPHG
eukprot:TRINITY_DN4340_c0_g5_i1.p1 TRINITY_DN4340_c0_g5~~TRINITY_DN4340_c0_g5_i1.p1  ORF type:complete len:581 (+),score=200.93 TRINITY_DN4340_c0_g5_i1:72-1745(+)